MSYVEEGLYNIYILVDPQENRMIGFCQDGRDPRDDLEKRRGLIDLEMYIVGTYNIYEEHPEYIGRIMPRILWYYYQKMPGDFALNQHTPGNSYFFRDMCSMFGTIENVFEAYKNLIRKYKV